ncbi:tyrosine-type recombinase/integrase [Microvirga sp. SRT01]|uniref:Tyrosine-type recombinase/integrase n=1 Tax=Sphingomonas longa TaxID=2778730 RepID=A0ABS2DAA3_9SPHN|nr:MULTISPECIES: site-specific integrase [Alphaproteobacteria]MBM6577871.1 tyrosine-type recombinase/integrase [Sphingomonas sp. BT552]MBR7710912.1 tyrosine-type recombinase/integrase [Microvirga sp. SRT01]
MSGYKPTGRHREKVLTPAAVRNLKPGFHSDGGNLYLKVDPSGARRWIVRLNVQGKRRDIGLGSAAVVSLLEAREQALQHRKAARVGEDPLAAKRRLQAIPSFEEAANHYIEHRRGGWKSEKHRKQWSASLEKYAYPIMGSLQVSKVDSADILRVLDPIWVDLNETANRVRQRIGLILKWAIARGFRTDNPADAVQQALAKRDGSKRQRMKALPYDEVANAIDKVTESKASDATKLAFQFLVHTACRSGEVRGALWSEVDLAKRVWTVSADRMKAGKQHRVPLNDAAAAVLERAKALKQEDVDLVFPSTRGKPLSDMTLSKLMKELGIAAVPHGFRSSFRDWAAEQTSYPERVAEFALAHVIKDKAEAAYARSDLLDKRKSLMADWGQFLAERPTKSTI